MKRYGEFVLEAEKGIVFEVSEGRKGELIIRALNIAMTNGKIIEHYYDDYPYPSCLILGYNINNKIIHIVCGVSEDTVHMITAYYPNTDKWEEDMKTRREK